MNKISIQSDVAAEDPLKRLRVLAISDAAPSRNGAGAYYLDLLEHMKGKVKEARLFSPTINENGKWQAGLVLPLPGDKTQKLCFPNIFRLNRIFKDMQPDIVVIATPGIYGITGAWLARRHKVPSSLACILPLNSSLSFTGQILSRAK